MPKYKRILLIDNYDSFTYNLVDYFRQLGAEVLVYRNQTPVKVLKKIEFDLLVLSPGPGIPGNAGNLMEIIDCFHSLKPIFGVCLGMQALVEFFGGSLKYSNPIHGKSDQAYHQGIGVFSDLENPLEIGRYHSLSADSLPKSLEISARNREQLIMGVRHKYLPIEGVQFHPESILSARNNQGFKLIENVMNKRLSLGNTAYFTLMKKLQNEVLLDGEDFKVLVDLLSKKELNEDQKLILLVSLSFQLKQPYALNDFLNAILEKSEAYGSAKTHALDVCGTGGSGLPRLNTSTIASFLLANYGLPIAKHGNKAASGRYGSFDLLEDLGLDLDSSMSQVKESLSNTGLGFLYAPKLHPTVGQFAASRNRMGVPTLFNVLGPLLNPVNPKFQLIGTAFEKYMDLILETAVLQGKEKVFVVRGGEGLDEISVSEPTQVLAFENGNRRRFKIEPENFGIERIPFERVAVHKPEDNFLLAQEIIHGNTESDHAKLVLVNAAFVYSHFIESLPLQAAYEKMKTDLESGKAVQVLNQIIPKKKEKHVAG